MMLYAVHGSVALTGTLTGKKNGTARTAAGDRLAGQF